MNVHSLSNRPGKTLILITVTTNGGILFGHETPQLIATTAVFIFFSFPSQHLGVAYATSKC